MTSLLVILLVLAACAALTAQLVWWLSNRRDTSHEAPPLVIPIHPDFRRQPERQEVAAATLPDLIAAEYAPNETAPTEIASTETVRFARPGDAAVQLLPARFQVVAGMLPEQELRFVRVPGVAPEMILGRDASSSPQQVTLASSTVSRRHARVAFADGRWLVTNLSRTNPVVVNDEALDVFQGARPLADGDRLELGDVVLRFRAS